MPYGHIYLTMVELVCNLPGNTDKVFWPTANGQMNQRDEEAELSQQTFLHGQTSGSSYNCWCFNFCLIPFGYHLMLRRLYLESSPPSRYSWTRLLSYFCSDDQRRATRCVSGGVANCPAMPEGNTSSGRGNLQQTGLQQRAGKRSCLQQ